MNDQTLVAARLATAFVFLCVLPVSLECKMPNAASITWKTDDSAALPPQYWGKTDKISL